MADRLPAALRASVQTRRVRLYEVSGVLRPGLLRRAVEGDRRRLDSVAARLNVRALGREVDQKRRDLTRAAERLSRVACQQVRGWQDRLDALERLRQTVGYEATLNRGYAVVRGDGAVVKTRAEAEAATALEIQFADGRLDVGAPQKPAKPASKPRTKPPEQGSLF
jgi:exodeoxyribonuclease VII large subunit